MRPQFALLAAALASKVSASSFEKQCAKLASSLTIANATVWFTESVAAGTNLTFPDNDATCARPSQVVSVDMCRVALYVATTSRSGISMEAWLPKNWTGRFLSTGNGGLSGCIQYEDLAYTVGLGFSTVGANNGHNGTSGKAFYNNPEVVNDFAYRSVHTGVVVGKEISKSFYGKTHKKSYYLGCSTGGRQGFKSAQAYPDDFDGIVAGAPAVAFTNLTSWSGHFFTITGTKNSSSFVPANLWPIIHKDILAQCDGLDGAVDGILEDPLLCNYRPESLICQGTNTTNCLTGTQAAAVRAIYSPLYGNGGALVFPRLQPGAELLGLSSILFTGAGFSYTDDWFEYVVFNTTSWDPATLGPDDYDLAATQNPGNIQTWEPLTGYHAKGGKILHYHGQQDPIISSDNSPRYYDFVSRSMNLPSTSLDEFYRFFRISGMSHCSGGEGASFIGQKGASTATYDPSGNVLTAMVQWVEKGIAPDTITGTKYVNGTQSLGVDYTRKHCRYPYRNAFQGGDVKNPNSWKCVL